MIRERIVRRSATKQDRKEYRSLTGRSPARIKKETLDERQERLWKDRVRHRKKIVLPLSPSDMRPFPTTSRTKLSLDDEALLMHYNSLSYRFSKEELNPTDPKVRKRTLNRLRQRIVRRNQYRDDLWRYEVLTSRSQFMSYVCRKAGRVIIRRVHRKRREHRERRDWMRPFVRKEEKEAEREKRVIVRRSVDE